MDNQVTNYEGDVPIMNRHVRDELDRLSVANARLTEEKAELEGTIRDWASSVPPSELVTLKAENKALTEENTRLREALKSAKWALEGGSDDDVAYDEICAALVKGEAK